MVTAHIDDHGYGHDDNDDQRHDDYKCDYELTHKSSFRSDDLGAALPRLWPGVSALLGSKPFQGCTVVSRNEVSSNRRISAVPPIVLPNSRHGSNLGDVYV